MEEFLGVALRVRMAMPVSSRTKTLLLSACAVFVAVYLGICAYMYSLQDQLIFRPSRDLRADPSDRGLDFETLAIPTQDGLTLSAWYVHAQGSAGHSRPVLFYCHGNAGNISTRLAPIELFARAGFDVFIFDYRGYGESSNAPPSEAGLYEDARASWAHLVQSRGVAPQRIILLGRSLGGPVATWLASRVSAAGLVLVSSFTRLPAVAALRYPWLPVGVLLRHEFAQLERIDSVGEAVMIMHSQHDGLIPYGHGRQLFERAREPRRFVELEGDHGRGIVVSQSRVIPALVGFARQVGAMAAREPRAHAPAAPSGGLQ